jgi:hypothetical protein
MLLEGMWQTDYVKGEKVGDHAGSSDREGSPLGYTQVRRFD